MTAPPFPDAPEVPDDLRVPVHRGWIVACMILFWPLAIAAVLAANRAARAHGAGDSTTARREAGRARDHARLGALIGAIWSTLALTLDITLVVLGVQHGPGLLGQAGIETATAEAPPETYRSAAAPKREAITLDPFALQTGDCFMAPDWEAVWNEIDVIPCSRPHDVQVIGVTEHLHDEYPGAQTISEEAWYDCWAEYDSYSGTIGSEDSPVWTFEPNLEDWTQNRHTSVCFIEAPFPVQGEFSEYPQIFEPEVDA